MKVKVIVILLAGIGVFYLQNTQTSTSKTQNIFVYPMWGPVLPNSGAPWALDLGGDPVLDNMAPP